VNYTPQTTESSFLEQQGLHEEEMARMLKALPDPSRLSIFNMLMDDVQCNREIFERLGFSLSLVPHHLRVLHDVGLVQSERDVQDGRWISITRSTGRSLPGWVWQCGTCWPPTASSPTRLCAGPTAEAAEKQSRHCGMNTD
jgi:DNA-binding transcriptional ArsR family regulator